ncbi:hypothetical protein ANN_02624 [Periplaneta americana]|uniref:Uncharacterized protein n=1 Tax=Periplaneta americana TaxID=6978 RepID=A0ABQ8TWT5_PERAM|nr:hypothetical protein ANN_02624 [Periplaneta americana]
MEKNGTCEIDRQNNPETDQEEKKELAGLLAKKKLPTEGFTGRNNFMTLTTLHSILTTIALCFVCVLGLLYSGDCSVVIRGK